MSADTVICFASCLAGICFPLTFFIQSRWKYVPVIGLLISFILVANINDNCAKRPIYYKFTNLQPDGFAHITGKGTDAYRIDLSKVTPGCNLLIYNGFDYHFLYYFPPKVLLMEPIKCGDRVANQASIAYNGAN